MIKIFRKIRQKLLDQNKIVSYLKYAIGEILLVVIGILIALQVNDWNENRKLKILEQRLLNALLEEFDSNLEILQRSMQLNDSIIASSLKLGEFTGPELESYNEKEISEALVGAFKFESRFFANQGTVQEIISSGKLSVLSNAELRKALSSWEPTLDLVRNQEDYVVEQRNLAHNFFLSGGNFRRHLEIIDDNLIDVSPSRFPNNKFDFLKNQEFESQLFLFIVASENLNQVFYAALKTKIETIRNLIRKGIN